MNLPQLQQFHPPAVALPQTLALPPWRRPPCRSPARLCCPSFLLQSGITETASQTALLLMKPISNIYLLGGLVLGGLKSESPIPRSFWHRPASLATSRPPSRRHSPRARLAGRVENTRITPTQLFSCKVAGRRLVKSSLPICKLNRVSWPLKYGRSKQQY